MKTGTSMSSIINTRKFKKNRTMIKCNCSICVNKEKNGCRFGWQPINGKCNRFGTNHYKLTKEEKEQARKQTLINKKKFEEEKKIQITSLSKLSEYLETTITKEIIQGCKKSKYLGNGRLQIKCLNSDELLINVRFKDNKLRKFKVLEK